MHTHGAALRGQGLAGQGLAHRPPMREQGWGRQPAAPVIRDACGDRAGPSSSWDIKSVGQDLDQQGTGATWLEHSSGRDQPQEPQQPQAKEKGAPDQSS